MHALVKTYSEQLKSSCSHPYAAQRITISSNENWNESRMTIEFRRYNCSPIRNYGTINLMTSSSYCQWNCIFKCLDFHFILFNKQYSIRSHSTCAYVDTQKTESNESEKCSNKSKWVNTKCFHTWSIWREWIKSAFMTHH